MSQAIWASSARVVLSARSSSGLGRGVREDDHSGCSEAAGKQPTTFGTRWQEQNWVCFVQISFITYLPWDWGSPGGSGGKVSACNVGDLGSIPGLGRSPGEGNGSPLQYSCLENPMDGGAWRAAVHGISESDTTE